MRRKAGNAHLNRSKKNIDDEFYTRLEDIESEVEYYKRHFRGKVVYLNCDNPERSNFWKYFVTNQKRFGIKKLIATHFRSDKRTYSLEVTLEDPMMVIRKELKQNGDFRSSESIEILKECDIVVTNPPFSLLPEYMDQLVKYDKKFLIIGPDTTPGIKNIFPLFSSGDVVTGTRRPRYFARPDGSRKAVGAGWITNMDSGIQKKYIETGKSYTPEAYPQYDNYDAIEVGKIKDIPMDYYGAMGVPVTIFVKLNPNQFDVVHSRKGDDGKDLRVDGRNKFSRIVIKRKV